MPNPNTSSGGRRRAFVAAFVTGLVVTGAKIWLNRVYGGSSLDPFDALAYRIKHLALGHQPFPGDVVVVAIDETSIRELGPFPWPRQRFAELTRKLADARASAVAFDVLFQEKQAKADLEAVTTEVARATDAAGPGRVADELRNATDVLRRLTRGDSEFAQALKESGRGLLAIHLATAADLRGAGLDPEHGADWLFDVAGLPPAAVPVSHGTRTDFRPVREHQTTPLFAAPPVEDLFVAAGAGGVINTVPDSDGVVRAIQLVVPDARGRLLPGFALAAYARARGVSHRDIQAVAASEGGSALGGVALVPPTGSGEEFPVSADGRMFLRFYGSVMDREGKASIPTFPMADVLAGRLPAGAVAGKVVLVGATATGLYDRVALPRDADAVPGVYVHALAVENLIRRDFLRRPPEAAAFEVGVMMAIAVVASFLFLRVRPSLSLPALVVCIFGYSLADAFVALPRGVLLGGAAPVMELVLVFLVATGLRFRAEERAKLQVRDAFSRYLDKSVMEEVLAQPELLRLGGEKRETTVLFSDIRGFTTLAEKLPPEELVRTMNEYLTPMTQIVFRHGGTLDKYIGDAIMAFWGAPKDEPDHPFLACKAALEMLAEIDRLKARWRAQGRPEFDIGIGINTGVVSVGNMGSEMRFSYTVMGDAVNLASRLEGTNKEFGTRLIVSEQTYDRVKGRVTARELGSVQVKGRTAPVRIFEVACLA